MDLLERDAHLARLEEHRRHAAAGQGRVVLVGGEAGVGKTALVDAFARRAEPRTDWLDGTVKRDERGYIVTCRELSSRYDPVGDLWPRRDRAPFPLETSLPGVFAAGDVRHNSINRVAAAAGAGATAISSVHAYLAEEGAEEQARVIPLHGRPHRPRRRAS